MAASQDVIAGLREQLAEVHHGLQMAVALCEKTTAEVAQNATTIKVGMYEAPCMAHDIRARLCNVSCES